MEPLGLVFFLAFAVLPREQLGRGQGVARAPATHYANRPQPVA